MADAIETIWRGSSRNEWRRLATQAGAALQQDWDYGAANSSLGGRVARAIVRRAGEPIALAQFLIQDFGVGKWRAVTLATAFRGPVWISDPPQETKAAAVQSMIRSRPWGKRSILMFQPEEAAPWLSAARLRRVMTGHSTSLIDLEQEPDALRAAQHQKWRNRLVAAERVDGLKVLKNGVKPAQYMWLLEQEAAQQKSKGYQGLPVAFTPAYAAAGGKEAMTIFRADLNGKRAAAMLFLRHGDAATYHIGWSSDEGRKTGAHNLVLWKAMLSLRAAGVRLLDLGGVNTASGAGVARFKLGVGGRVTTLPGAYL
ncbi:MAG: GNAT family N-acetyltransferase [Neomegalonema sp.]|nr:GNAT family N-acetyltransferase [Neomegalonema sp.]